MPKSAMSFAVRIAAAVVLASLSLPAAADDIALQAALRAERARAPAPTIPRAAFLQRASVSDVVLSPDGRHVAWLREAGNRREVWLRPTAAGAARRLSAHTPAERLHWTRDGRWLLLEASSQVFALAAAGQTGSGLLTTLGGAGERRWMDVDDTMPAAIVVLEIAARHADGTPASWSLLRVDMRGRRTRLHRDPHRIVGYALDPQGRLAYVQRVEGLALSVRRVDAGMREVVRCSGMRRCTPLTTTPDGRGLWLRANVEDATGLLALMRLDADGRMRVVHVDPRGEADLDDLRFDPVTRQPLIASHRSTVAANHGLDADTTRHLRRLDALLPNMQDAPLDLRIGIGRGPDARWLIEARAGHRQGARWHLYDPASGAVAALFDDAPVDARVRRPAGHIPESVLARKIPVQWRASDGMRLHGFVMVPPGVDPATRPLVAIAHGGPWTHVPPTYNAIAQFLVNRGYVVFEPNFRASTGHGFAYTLAANGDFGNGRVQRDIVEGVRHVLAVGIGDPRRVGIVGASFGGYSALLGVTFQPELFKVGVAFVPPPDFAWTLRWILRNPESLSLGGPVPMRDWLRQLSLDVDGTDVDGRARMARLQAESPLANTARMNRPLLLVAGGEDRRVGIAGVIEYAARLKLAGKDVSLLVDADAGHANREALAREANFHLTEAMLHRHLGGPAPPPPDAELQRYLDANLRLCGRSSGLRCTARR